jgi:hypothetical protein
LLLKAQNNFILALGYTALAQMKLGEVGRARESAEKALAILVRAACAPLGT